jgi:DUF3071 family protein
MRELGLDGLSEDGRFLIARDPESDETFHIPADHRLTSLVGPSSRSGATAGQLEIKMESSLSPREIQTRIRRGETPQSVADSAGVPVDQIIGFAGPVLAEREYMCEQARKTTIRRKHVGGSGVLLGVLVNENIAADGGVPEAAAWDAWRREDGRWSVTVTPEGSEPASFLFDVKSRYVVPADEFAHGLVGDVALPDTGDMAIADAVRSPQRSAQQAADELVESLLEEQFSEPAPVPPPIDHEEHSGVASIKAARDRRAMEQLATDAEESDQSHAEAMQSQEVDEFEESIEHDVAVPDTMGPRKKRHERRRVPSWDEIMFGDKND